MPAKFTEDDLVAAVQDLATMRYFPSESRASIMRQLAAMCPHREALRFTVDRTLAATAEWPGMAELRGVLCLKYPPADGLDRYSTLPGCSGAEMEARYIESVQRELRGADWGVRLREIEAGE